MIYIDNDTRKQKVWIPKDEATYGSTKTQYELGYEDGFSSGFSSGYSSGVQYTQSLHSSTAFTENGEYTNVNAWSSVSVSVNTAATYQDGFQDGYNQGFQEGFESGISVGYTSGWTDGFSSGETVGFESGFTSGETVGFESGYSVGFDSGFSSGESVGYSEGYDSGYSSGISSGYSKGWAEGFPAGQSDIISTFTAFTADTNGQFGSSAHPISSLTVNIDTASTYNEGYQSGVTDGFSSGYSSGESAVIATFSSMTANTNGEYGSSAHPLSSITVEIAQTGYTQQDLDNAYSSGFSSGESAVIATFTADTATTNGVYGSSAHPLSSMTVNVDTASTYQSGYTDGTQYGYQIGYGDGVNDGEGSIISTFSSQTATTNGVYGSSAHPLSSITVDVEQTGTSINVETGRTANIVANGSYNIEPSSAIYSDNGHFDSDYDRYYFSASVSGYPQTGYFELFTIEDEFHSQYGSVLVYYEDGHINFEDDLSGGCEIWDYSITNNSIDIVISNANRNFDYSYERGTDFTYDAMSSVTVNVQVPTGRTYVMSSQTFTQNGTYQPNGITFVDYLITDGYDILWDTGVKMTSLNENVILDFAPLTGSIHYDAFLTYLSQQDNDSNWELGLRQSTAYNNNPSGNYWYTNGNRNNYSLSGLFSADTRAYVEISNTGITVNGVSSAVSTTSVVNTNSNIVINGMYASNANYRCPYAKYYGFKLMSGSTALADFAPALDENGHPCFYDKVSDTFIYHQGDGNVGYGNIISSGGSFDAWTAITVNVDTATTWNNGYSSGYSVGYDDGEQTGYSQGYADGEGNGYGNGYNDGEQAGIGIGKQNIIDTFTAVTATTNGSYGSTAHPLSSITVQVPQSGGSANLDTLYVPQNGTYDHQDFGVDGFSSVTVNTGNYIINVATDEFTIPIQMQDNYIVSASDVTLRYNADLVYGDGYLFSIFNQFELYVGRDGNLHIVNSDTPEGEDVISGITISGVSVSISTGGTFINGQRVSYLNSMPNASSNFYVFSSYSHTQCSCGEIKIYSGFPVSDSNMIADYVPAYDENHLHTFYNKIDGTYIYPVYGESAYATTILEFINRDERRGYISGWTAGYASGSSVGGNESFIGLIEGNATAITIPSGTTYIRDFAFSGLTTLSAITIPNSVTGIGKQIITGTSVSSITIPDSVTSLVGSAFTNNRQLKYASVGSGITELFPMVFAGCTGLTAVTLAEGIQTIRGSNFSGCTSLTDITIPDSVTSASTMVCTQCQSLTAATIGSGLANIPNQTFYGSTNLKNITFRRTTPPTVGSQNAFPKNSAYAGSGNMYVPIGSSASYQTWATTDSVAKLSFSGWTITEKQM